MGSNCLLTPLVIGNNRVPEPPASTIPFIVSDNDFLTKVKLFFQITRFLANKLSGDIHKIVYKLFDKKT